MRHIGVSNFDVDQLRQIQQIAPVETLQPQYSLIEREAERELLPFAEREAIGVIVYSPMGSGMLTGAMTRERIAQLPEDDWRRHDPRFRDPQLSQNLELVRRLSAVADRHDSTPGAVAVAWTLRNPVGRRRDRRLPATRPGRPDHHRREPGAQRRRRRRDRRADTMNDPGQTDEINTIGRTDTGRERNVGGLRRRQRGGVCDRRAAAA